MLQIPCKHKIFLYMNFKYEKWFCFAPSFNNFAKFSSATLQTFNLRDHYQGECHVKIVTLKIFRQFFHQSGEKNKRCYQ